jgi:hypothetical protein
MAGMAVSAHAVVHNAHKLHRVVHLRVPDACGGLAGGDRSASPSTPQATEAAGPPVCPAGRRGLCATCLELHPGQCLALGASTLRRCVAGEVCTAAPCVGSCHGGCAADADVLLGGYAAGCVLGQLLVTQSVLCSLALEYLGTQTVRALLLVAQGNFSVQYSTWCMQQGCHPQQRKLIDGRGAASLVREHT